MENECPHEYIHVLIMQPTSETWLTAGGEGQTRCMIAESGERCEELSTEHMRWGAMLVVTRKGLGHAAKTELCMLDIATGGLPQVGPLR